MAEAPTFADVCETALAGLTGQRERDIADAGLPAHQVLEQPLTADVDAVLANLPTAPPLLRWRAAVITGFHLGVIVGVHWARASRAGASS